MDKETSCNTDSFQIPPLSPLTCLTCGRIAIPNIQIHGPHIGAYCPVCDRWISWLKRPKPKPNWRDLPATEKQLFLLAKYGKGEKGMARGKAYDLIGRLGKNPVTTRE